MRTIQLVLAVLVMLSGAACATSRDVSKRPTTPSKAKPDEMVATQAYITACDRVLLNAVRDGLQMHTVAGRKDEMIGACDAVLAVSASPKSNAKVVAEYREVTREWRNWCKTRTDWRSFAASIASGTVAGGIDSVGGGGVALSLVLAAQAKTIHKNIETDEKIRVLLAQWNRQLANAGFQSAFWRNAPDEL